MCSILSAITTLGLIFLPQWYAPGDGLAARMARVRDPVYGLRAWVYLVHPLLTLTGAPAMWIYAALQPAGRALIAVWLCAPRARPRRCHDARRPGVTALSGT